MPTPKALTDMRVLGALAPQSGDTTAPSIPQNVVATAINAGRIDLSWAASTDAFGVSGYQIFRDDAPLTTTSGLTYSDTTCQPSTLYTYTIAAFDFSGNNSLQSVDAIATTPANAAPVWQTIPAQTLIVGNSYLLQFTDYCSDAELDTLTFSITAGTLPSGVTLSTNRLQGTPTTAGQTPTVTVRAADVFHQISTTISFSTKTADATAPPVPTGLTAAAVSSSQINVSWNASTDVAGSGNELVSGTKDYRIYRDGSLRTTQTGVTYSDTGLAASTAYAYRVSARDNALNESAQTTQVSATTQTSGSLFPEFPYDSTRSIVAGSLYVSPTGNNANNGLSSALPKQTIAAAVAAIGTSSSKKIYLMNGTHVPGTVVLAGSGTSTTKYEITSLPGHTPLIDCTATPLDAPAFRMDGVSWWRFSHLDWLGWGYGFIVAENQTTSNNEWFCNRGSTNRVGADNPAFIHFWQMSRAPNSSIDRLRLTFTGNPASVTLNLAGLYCNRDTTSVATFDHLEIFNFQAGVYHKHGDPNPTVTGEFTVSNSLFADCIRWPVGANPAGVVYTNCIIHGSEVYLSEADGGPAGDKNTFIHCTLRSGLHGSNQSGGALGNRLTNCVSAILLESPSTIDATSNYNLLPTISRWGSTLTLAQWRTTNASDANSIQGTPVYVGGNVRTAAAHALASGSPGKGAASDATDMGADVTRVGVQAA